MIVDFVSTAMNQARQKLIVDAEPVNLFGASIRLSSKWAKVELRRTYHFTRHCEAQAHFYSASRPAEIYIAPRKVNDSNNIRLARCCMHELTHVLRHFAVGNHAFSKPADGFPGYTTRKEMRRLELEAELTAYAVVSAFTRHPALRRLSREYLRNWSGASVQNLEPFYLPEVIEFLTDGLAEHL